MKIKVEKKLIDNDIVKTEELHFEIPLEIVDELAWDDGTLVEWESNGSKIVLRNIDDKILGDVDGR